MVSRNNYRSLLSPPGTCLPKYRVYQSLLSPPVTCLPPIVLTSLYSVRQSRVCLEYSVYRFPLSPPVTCLPKYGVYQSLLSPTVTCLPQTQYLSVEFKTNSQPKSIKSSFLNPGLTYLINLEIVKNFLRLKSFIRRGISERSNRSGHNFKWILDGLGIGLC